MAHRMDVDGIIDKLLTKQVQDTGQQYAVPPMEETFSTAKCFWGCLLLCVPRQCNLISSPLVKRYVCMYVNWTPYYYTEELDTGGLC
jgi:hypothetical protein